jgi:hypothetical protein
MIRYRNTGDYVHAHTRGWLKVFADASEVFARFYSAHGLPARFVPWGSVPAWYADLRLERDIDVLWMGNLRTRRRTALLAQIRAELARAGYTMYVADDRENPYIYGEARTRLLNRAKITLSLLAQAKHDNIFHVRFQMAAPNRSLLVTERELPHCPMMVEGEHYAAAEAEALTGTLLYYLRNEKERAAMVEKAYRLATTRTTMRQSVETLLEWGKQARERP